MKLFFSVGEPSGDLHGANLVRELRRLDASVECVGFGGPRMQQAGCRLHEDLTQLAVMWFLRAILNLHRYWQLVCRADRYFRHERPDAVILIDYPGFNWWIARRAKVHGIPVFYYGAPQMWAWASWRIHKMRRLVDHVLCKLPFEAEWYCERGCDATYVGHPYFDELDRQHADVAFLNLQRRQEAPLVTLLPGSRTQEVTSHLEQFMKAIKHMRADHPEARFAIASFNERQAHLARKAVEAESLPVEVHVGRTAELIQAADVCLACSGSVSLELLYHRKPTVIVYHVGRVAFWLQQRFRKVRYITLVNLLASKHPYCSAGEGYDPDFEEVPFPEYLTSSDRSEAVAKEIGHWLTDASSYAETVARLEALRSSFARPGATNRAALYIIQHTAGRKAGRVHYTPPHADAARAA